MIGIVVTEEQNRDQLCFCEVSWGSWQVGSGKRKKQEDKMAP